MTGEGAGPTLPLGVGCRRSVDLSRETEAIAGRKRSHPVNPVNPVDYAPPVRRYSIRQARNAATRAWPLTGAIAPNPACGVESFALTAGPTAIHDVPSALAWQA